MAKRRTASKKAVDEASDELPPRQKNRFLRRLAILCLLLIALVGVAPFLVANSPLRDMLLNWQMPVGGWRIQCERTALSWTGSQSLANVTIADPAGNPLVTLESLSLGRSILGLAFNSRNLGTLRIVKPTAYLATRPDGSNIEDFLTALKKQQSSSSTAASESTGDQFPKSINLEVVEGALRGLDTVSGQQWNIEQINLTASHDHATQLTAEGTAEISGNQKETSGRIKFRILPLENNRQQLDLLADGLQFEPLAIWLARFVGPCQLSGTTSLDAHTTWNQSATGELELETWGRAETTTVQFTGDVLKGDKLSSDKLEIPWKLSVADGEINVEELKLDGDWAQVSATGSLALSELRDINWQSLPKKDFDINAELSLAKLAAMLPATLQIREGVRVDSGDLEFSAETKKVGEQYSWLIAVSLASLAGQDRGRVIKWEESLEIADSWVESPTGSRLDRVKLTAPFAQGEFTTHQDRIAGEFKLNLNQIAEELGQFVDFHGITGRGIAQGKLLLTASEGDAFAAEADITLNQFALSQGDQDIWKEPELLAKLHAVGTSAHLTPKSISTGSLVLQGASDSLTVDLTSPVDLASLEEYSFRMSSAGKLDSWSGRLRPWLKSVPTELSGDATLQAKVAITKGSAQEISDIQGNIDNLHVRSGKVAIDEPHVKFSGEGGCHFAERKLTSPSFQFASSVVALRSRELRFEFPSHGVPVMTGEVAIRTDLERLSRTGGLTGSWPRGSASSVMRFATNAEQVIADFSFDAENLQLVKSQKSGPPIVAWSEPKLHSEGKAVYAIATERASVENLSVDGQTMSLVGDASWDKPISGGPLTVSGNLQYEPAAFVTLTAGYLGPNVQIEGDGLVKFEAQGVWPAKKELHWSRSWQAEAEAGWNRAAVFGLPISAGKLQGALAEGQLRTAPVDVAVGAGRLTASALATLDPGPERVVIPAGPLISNVEISPAVSEQMLKYVAPILAGATRVDGQFSLDLADTQIALADPKQTRTAGTLTVHQLTVLPGPLLVDIVGLIQRIQTLKDLQNLLGAAAAPQPAKLLSMNDQQIEFQVVDGRVYHRKLEFVIDDVAIRSTGSVGFDQTLALMIEIPIQDRWIDGDAALAGLAGQTLQIPIQGTFQRPRVDERVIADITKQLIRNTAGQAIGNEINRQLEKLFQGK